MVDLEQEEDPCTLDIGDAHGNQSRAHASWLLGCDGGRSAVRWRIGIAMRGVSYDQPWLVIDTVNDPHSEEHGLHYGESARPHVIVPGRDGRCRYEFLLHDGEGRPGDIPSARLVADLLAPYRRIEPHEIERAIIYTFHALVAERWQVERCFLLGDAAHMMPPFAGQGLNSGIRDAGNLFWKLSQFLNGRLAPTTLRTYEIERRPHAESTVGLSARLGATVMTTSRCRAAARNLLARAAMRTPPGRRYLTQMAARKPARRVGTVVASRGYTAGTARGWSARRGARRRVEPARCRTGGARHPWRGLCYEAVALASVRP
jgi:3-(3-hydroxy-phenyl)propionate hydroxylase